LCANKKKTQIPSVYIPDNRHSGKSAIALSATKLTADFGHKSKLKELRTVLSEKEADQLIISWWQTNNYSSSTNGLQGVHFNLFKAFDKNISYFSNLFCTNFGRVLILTLPNVRCEFTNECFPVILITQQDKCSGNPVKITFCGTNVAIAKFHTACQFQVHSFSDLSVVSFLSAVF